MRTKRRSLFLAIVGAAFIGYSLIAAAWAATGSAFSDSAFSQAQASGKPVLIEIYASWCSVCRAQAPIIGELSAQPKFKDLTIFKIDFDSQKAEVKRFGAQMQSTLIVFKGGKEVGRSVGDTKRASIAALLEKAN